MINIKKMNKNIFNLYVCVVCGLLFYFFINKKNKTDKTNVK